MDNGQDDYDDGRFAGTTRSTFGGRGGGRKPEAEPVVFEARIETETAKAYLVEPTVIGCNGQNGMTWVPKSQIKAQRDTGPNRKVELTVSAWWWGKQLEEGVFDA